jgi:outer membrane protein TolC
LNLYSAEKQLEITNRSIIAANQNFESAKERFEVGTATIVDYLTANTQLITAKINRVNAVYNYFDAQVQVKFALGSI